MFRTSYVHLQEDYIVHAALYDMFSMRLCKQSSRLKDVLGERILQPARLLVKTKHIRLHVKYGLPEDEHKVFETCRREEELN
jgi:hypothetical protein